MSKKNNLIFSPPKIFPPTSAERGGHNKLIWQYFIDIFSIWRNLLKYFRNIILIRKWCEWCVNGVWSSDCVESQTMNDCYVLVTRRLGYWAPTGYWAEYREYTAHCRLQVKLDKTKLWGTSYHQGIFIFIKRGDMHKTIVISILQCYNYKTMVISILQ